MGPRYDSKPQARQEQFPGSIQIVDLYHAKELQRADPAGIAAWVGARGDELETGRLEMLRSASICEKARKCAEYVEHNRKRMRYAHFRAKGPRVGSGMAESGCKSIVGGRLKRSGMFWTVDGANAIIALRCAQLSNRFEDYWEDRAVA